MCRRGQIFVLSLVMCFALFTPFHANAKAEVTIQGIDNDALEQNVRLLLHEVESPVGRINEEKFQSTLLAQAQKALQAYGYYDALIEVTNLQFFVGTQEQNNREKSLSYTLTVELGAVARIAKVVLINDLEQIESQAIPQQILDLLEQVKALEGKPLDHKQYESLKNKLKTFPLLYGYFDFSFPLHKLIIEPATQAQSSDGSDKANTSALVHWIFYLGQRYKFGDIRFLNDARGQALAKDVKPFKRGDYFQQSMVSEYSIDLQSTEYFESTLARANAKDSQDYHVPIEVLLQPKPKDTFEFGVGVSTDTGPRVTVDWSRPWVNLDGHSLGATLYVSRPRRSFELNYRIPKANPLNDFYNFQAGYRQTDENQTRSDTASLSVHRQWGAEEEDEWDKIAFLKFERESFTQGLAEQESTNLLLPGFTFTRTRKRGDIFVSWGDFQTVTVEVGSKALISDIDFFKIEAKTKWIRELGKHRFIFRADAGAIATNDFSLVPSTQRFFAGGDQSVRGFGLNELSDFEVVTTEDGEETVLNGGKFLAVASMEYAYPVAEKWRAAAFIDAGNANDNPFSEPAYGFGLGAHWQSPIGTVRLYLARGISDIPKNEKSWAVHLIIGPGV